MMPSVLIHPEVEDALRSGRPVVALESAVITSGLPRAVVTDEALAALLAGTRAGETPVPPSDGEPLNLALAWAMERTVREAGAVPATVAVMDGVLHIGVSADELAALATEESAGKASSADLAFVMARRGTAGTTVSATLIACALTQATKRVAAATDEATEEGNKDFMEEERRMDPPSLRRSVASSLSPHPGIRVFATGGIGGVHRGWREPENAPDISADLRAIATTPVCVVCAGAKSILDLSATLEALETLGVPVLGYRTSAFPRFHALGDERLPLSRRVEDAAEAARCCALHWSLSPHAGAVILANPVPAEHAMDERELEAAVSEAEARADAQGVSGAARTPFLLSELARLTQGRALIANIALLLNNVRLAAAVAMELARM